MTPVLGEVFVGWKYSSSVFDIYCEKFSRSEGKGSGCAQDLAVDG